MSYIEEFCDSIAIIHKGEVVLHGDLKDIKYSYSRDKLVIVSPEADRIRADFGAAATLTADGSVLLRLSDPAEKQAVMRRLAENYEIDGMKVFEPSLNDIFVEYASKEGEEK